MLTTDLTNTTQLLDACDDAAATENGWSDRNPATIVKRTAKTITVQRDMAVCLPGMTIFERDFDAPLRTYSLRANGRWISKGAPANSRGASLTLGYRSFHRDPSF